MANDAAGYLKAMDEPNPYAPPTVDEVSAIHDQENDKQLASLGERFAGALIDGIINAVLSSGVIYLLALAGLFSSFTGVMATGDFLTTALINILGYVIFILINFKFLSESGQTIGKKAAKTKIATMNGHTPSMGDLAIKRYGFYYVLNLIPIVGGFLALIDVLFIFRSDRRCLHDLVAGTQVIKAAPALTAKISTT